MLIVADVTHRDEVKGVVAKAIARFCRIDVWVNNVGQGITIMPAKLEAQAREVSRLPRVMRTNSLWT